MGESATDWPTENRPGDRTMNDKINHGISNGVISDANHTIYIFYSSLFLYRGKYVDYKTSHGSSY